MNFRAYATVTHWAIRHWQGPLLLSTLKGHTDTVTSVAFAPDCHTLATSSADRTVRLWQCASLCEREPTYRRFNVELDHATASCFSPDSKYLLLALEQSLNIQVGEICYYYHCLLCLTHTLSLRPSRLCALARRNLRYIVRLHRSTRVVP